MEANEKVKQIAKRVKEEGKKLGYDIKLGHALELTSRALFNQNWNIVSKRKDLDLNFVDEKSPKDILEEFKEKHRPNNFIGKFFFDYKLNQQGKKISNILNNNFNIKDWNNQNKVFKCVVQMLKNGELRDKFNMGYDLEKEQFEMKDFTKEPNALFLGVIGTGSVLSSRFTLTNWMIANSDKTMLYLIDSTKGCTDFQDFFKYQQVHTIINGYNDKLIALIEMLYKEHTERKKVFNENGGGIINYENKKKKRITRHVLYIEQFHVLGSFLMNDKEIKIEGSIPYKFRELMMLGRETGIFFITSSQRATKSIIHPLIMPHLCQKRVFKNYDNDDIYAIGHDKTSKLSFGQRGRCFSEYSEYQFPDIDDKNTKKLLEKYMQPNKGISFTLDNNTIRKKLLNPYLIIDKMPLLKQVRYLSDINPTNLITAVYKRMGCEVEELKENQFYISHIITFKNGNKSALLYDKYSRYNLDLIKKMKQGMIEYDCRSGIIHVVETPGQALYKNANESNIEIIDQEDWMELIKRLS